jgi:hypothetical protein
MTTSMISRSRLSAVAPALPPPAAISLPAALSEQLSELYALVQRSPHVFGSPVGPFVVHGRTHQLPRFVYFGPHASDAALRLSFLAGLDHRDLRPTLALLRLVQGLALKPDLGQGLNLSFFPLIDVLGLAGVQPNRTLATENWATTSARELELLERDARLRGYHGFVRLETAPGEDVVTIVLRGAPPLENDAPGLEIISSDDVDPLPVRWESEPVQEVRTGPLAIADDLPVTPFELIVRLPGSWPLDRYARAASSILKRFVIRYRGFIAYAQNL